MMEIYDELSFMERKAIGDGEISIMQVISPWQRHEIDQIRNQYGDELDAVTKRYHNDPGDRH
jgi:hypothetical protein